MNTRPLVMAHRGASRQALENTTMAFRRAGELCADGVELDVRLCASGELVVHHNPTLDDGRVILVTPKASLPGHVPTLDEALDACTGMWVNIEIKNDPAEPDHDESDRVAHLVAEVLVRRGETPRWLISSFRRETVNAMRSIAPAVATAWLTTDVEDAAATAAALVSAGHAAIHPWVGSLTQDTVLAMHDHGLAVNVWTCDDPGRMLELAEWGVDGICTNLPDVARDVLGLN
jgi:glycerophosphoryl diester phosphodiesterase